MEKKKLPQKSKKHKGLMIYCSNNSCKKYFTWTQKSYKKNDRIIYRDATCGITGKGYGTCKSLDKHYYKMRLYLPVSSNASISRTLKADNYLDAVREAIDFEKEIKEQKNDISIAQQTKNKPTMVYLLNAQSAYIMYLENIDVADHLKKERSDKHIKEVFKSLSLFNEALTKHKLRKKEIRLVQIDDKLVGYFHSYLIDDKGYANKTYNNKMGVVKSFFDWAITQYELDIPNPFKKVRNRTTVKNVDTISMAEYTNLLNIISDKNGVVYVGKNKKQKRNRYRPWLKSAIELALHTGGRREEVINLKWNMIGYIDNQPSYLEVPNFKVERSKGEGFNDNVAPKIIPITVDLMELLQQLGYDQFKDNDQYILEMNRSISVTILSDNLSKGFSHFYKLLETGKGIQFKHLRKTYISYMKMAMGIATKNLTAHANDAVIDKHYIDKKVIATAQRKFKLFKQ